MNDQQIETPSQQKEKENAIDLSIADLGPNFMKDMSNEDSFLSKVKIKRSFFDIIFGRNKLDTEIESMIRTYNEQLDSMCRLRFDVEIYGIVEQRDLEYNQKKKSAIRALELRRVTIEVIRKQIIEKLQK